jgi:hypothetical protein
MRTRPTSKNKRKKGKIVNRANVETKRKKGGSGAERRLMIKMLRRQTERRPTVVERRLCGGKIRRWCLTAAETLFFPSVSSFVFSIYFLFYFEFDL